ncbi:deoxyribonuclease IV, partial [Staphylococcus aureus]|nr:deoxyribonuclease IV [Staphylococcus aureus]
MSVKKILDCSAIEAHEYCDTTFMIYTGAAKNTRRKSIEDLNITKGHEVMENYGLSNIVVHAPYIINIANTTKPET